MPDGQIGHTGDRFPAGNLCHSDDFQHAGADIVERSALKVIKLAEHGTDWRRNKT